MKYIGHNLQYSTEEHIKITSFMSSVYKATDQLDDFSIARFELWVYEHFTDNTIFYQNNCRIWRDINDEIVGIFISEDGENGFHLINHPDNTKILEIMLSYLFNVWAKEKTRLWTELSEFKMREHEIYSQYGIVKTGSYGMTRYYDLVEFNVLSEISDDYYVESARTSLNESKHTQLIKNAFNKDFYSEELYEKLRKSPNYSDDLDITIYSKTGMAISTCTGWIDLNNKIAEIETVGTHSEFRQRGLARLTMFECMLQLKKKGYSKVYISSFNEVTHKFYDSFRYENKQLKYDYSWIKSTK